jgi:zinc protease
LCRFLENQKAHPAVNPYHLPKKHCMRLWSSLLLCALSLPIWLGAQMKPVKFERFKLANGLTVILHEDHSTPIVVTSVLYHVGSKNENTSRNGFAHFFEHLLFEGSENVARGEFDKYLSGAGAVNNAYTMQDHTYYYEVLPSNQLPLAIWLESERMLHAKVENKGIETQRQVVKEERRQRVENQPYGRIAEEIMKRAYTVHPYSWTPIGSMAHLDAAQESDYVNFYKDFYVPDNAVLVIAGDINPIETRKLVEKYFSTIPKSKKPIFRPTVNEPLRTKEIRDTVFDKVQLPALIVAYPTPARTDKDFYALEMLNKLLSGGQSSRIYKKMVDEKQFAVAAGSFAFQLEHPGINVVFNICNLGVDLKDVEATLDAEIDNVRNNLVPEKEFQKLRNQIEVDMVNKNSELEGIAENLATYETYFGGVEAINTQLDQYLKVTREDIQRVAKKYLDKNQRIILYWVSQRGE